MDEMRKALQDEGMVEKEEVIPDELVRDLDEDTAPTSDVLEITRENVDDLDLNWRPHVLHVRAALVEVPVKVNGVGPFVQEVVVVQKPDGSLHASPRGDFEQNFEFSHNPTAFQESREKLGHSKKD